MVKMYRQGDILLVEYAIENVDSFQQLKHKVVAEGELTGHKHEFKSGAVLLEDSGKNMFVRVTAKQAALVHNEHDTIQIPEGTYRVVRQREYDVEAIRYVSD